MQTQNKTTLSWFDVQKYSDFLTRFNFNEEQINFLIDQRRIYETAKRNTETVVCGTCGNSKEVRTFDNDTYEREMWYTMNCSGLFEKDDEDNKTGIKNWTPDYTRLFITEVK
jgi:hypothetical protein